MHLTRTDTHLTRTCTSTTTTTIITITIIIIIIITITSSTTTGILCIIERSVEQLGKPVFYPLSIGHDTYWYIHYHSYSMCVFQILLP